MARDCTSKIAVVNCEIAELPRDQLYVDGRTIKI